MANIARPRVVGTDEDGLPFDLPDRVTIALKDLAGAAKQGLLALSVGLGLATMGEIYEAEMERLVGPRGKHDPGRTAYRHGEEPRQLTLGGRRVQVMKPRARTKTGEEVELPVHEFFANRDLLTEAALNRMLNRLSSRRYRHGLEPVGVPPLATAKSSISRRFVVGTAKKLGELLARDLSGHDLLALFFDGIETDEHTIVVALGVDVDGHKHALGLAEGSTENRAVCQRLINDLTRRGLDPELSRLVVIDGGKGLARAVRDSFGKHALIHRCRAHKRRNVMDHLPNDLRAFYGNKIDRIYRIADADTAAAELRSLAGHLETDHPGAAASLREGLDETLTINRLRLSPTLAGSFKTTNPIESMISVARDVTGNVKRWRSGSMVVRWTAAGVLEAEKRFRRVKGYRDLQLLRAALNAHDASLTHEEGRRAVAAG